MNRYFTLSSAKRLLQNIPEYLSDSQLQRHIVKLRDFKGYIDRPDMPRLISGGYFGIVCAPSASGLVPQDIWLQTNLGQALDMAIAERAKRLRRK